MPTLCRLEYLTPDGWTVGHAGVNLLEPHRYPERLRANGKFGRVTELDPDTLQPTGQVWAPDPADLPDPSTLVKSATHIPKLPDPTKTCAVCTEEHPPPYDGSCLL